ncbi:hypothetical protein H632_c4092p0, partial [Helicosporidium sp. ATCC 50920]
TLADLKKILPGVDPAFRGKAYPTCAVVGRSGSLLLRRYGPSIDAQSVVFRFDDAPTEGYAPNVGVKTSVRWTAGDYWGFHERAEEVILVPTRSKDAIVGLVWNIQQPSPLNLLATDPDFENWVAGSFAFDPGAELKGALLALHVCRHVTLFGVGLGREQGVGARYDDACGAGELSAARAAMAAERGGLEPGLDEVTAALARRWETLSALHEAGMLSFGEPCVVECRGQRDEGE